MDDGEDKVDGLPEPAEDEAGRRKRRPPALILRGPEREQAMALVETLLVRRYDRTDISKALRNRYGQQLPDAMIQRLLREVAARWQRESEDDREARVEAQRRALLRLYRQAESDKEWRVCVEIEKLLSKMDGTAAPQKVSVASPTEWAELEGRSQAELLFFAEHGYWPERAPDELSNGARSKKAGTNGHAH